MSRRPFAPAARSRKALMLGAMLMAAAGKAAACFVAIEAHSAAVKVSAAEIEKVVTVPLELALQPLGEIQQIHSQTSEDRVRIELRCTAADAAAVADTVRERLRSVRLGLDLRAGDPRVWPIERPLLIEQSR
jgi:Cu/Ag efflux pump CusA